MPRAIGVDSNRESAANFRHLAIIFADQVGRSALTIQSDQSRCSLSFS
jgi:hypothetical protein